MSGSQRRHDPLPPRAPLHRQHYAERKNLALRRKLTDTLMTLRDRADAVAAVSVVRLIGGRQAVPEHDPAAVRIPNLEQKVVLPDTAVKLYPAAGRLLLSGGVQRILQAVGEQGAQLRVGDDQCPRHSRFHR